MIKAFLSLLALQAVPEGQPSDDHVELDGGPVCDYGEDRPRLPGPQASRADFHDLILGQRLREPDREKIERAFLERYPGPATQAFLTLTRPKRTDRPETIRAFERIASAYAASDDPDLRLEAARARFMLIGAWKSRHSGRSDITYLNIHESYRKTSDGRRWSALLDAFLRDYRGKGAAYDEFVARAELDAYYRSAADRTPGSRFGDDRMFDPEVKEIGAALRESLKPLIARYEGSANERVQRTVEDMMDRLARYDLGPEALAATDRAIVDRYENARDHALRAAVDGRFERLRSSLEELGRTEELARIVVRHEAWKQANPGPDCEP